MKKLATFLVLTLIALISVPPAEAQQSQIGNFTVQKDTDIISDENRSFALAVSDDEEVSVGVKCLSDGLNVLFVTDDSFLGGDSDDRVRLIYRFDSAEPIGPISAELGPENQLIGLPLHRVDRFVQKMRQGHQLAVRIQDPLDDQTYDGVISLRGATRAINAIGSCP